MKVKLSILLAVLLMVSVFGAVIAASAAENDPEWLSDWTTNGTVSGNTVELAKETEATGTSQTLVSNETYTNFELVFDIVENQTTPFSGVEWHAFGIEVDFGAGNSARFAAGIVSEEAHSNTLYWGGGGASDNYIWFHASGYGIRANEVPVESTIYMPDSGKVKLKVEDGRLEVFIDRGLGNGFEYVPRGDSENFIREEFRTEGKITIKIVDSEGVATGTVKLENAEITSLDADYSEAEALRLDEIEEYKYTPESWTAFEAMGESIAEALATIQGPKLPATRQAELDAAVAEIENAVSVLEYKDGYNSFDSEVLDGWTTDGEISNGVVKLEGKTERIQTKYLYTDFELIFNITANNTVQFSGHAWQSFGIQINFGEIGNHVRLAAGIIPNRDANIAYWGGGDASNNYIWFHASGYGVRANGVDIESQAYFPDRGTVKIVVQSGKLEIFIDKGLGNGFEYIPGISAETNPFVSESFKSAGAVSIGLINEGECAGSIEISDLMITNLGTPKVPVLTSLAGQSDNLTGYKHVIGGGNDLSMQFDTSDEKGIPVNDFIGASIGNVMLTLNDEYTYAQSRGNLSSLNIKSDALDRAYIANKEGAPLKIETTYGYALIDLSFENNEAYDVVFYGTDGSVLEEFRDIPYGESFTQAFPALPQDAVGWYLDGKLLDGTPFIVDGDKEIRALTDEAEFSVTLYFYEGGRSTEIIEETITVAYGDTVEFEVPDVYGYVFTGWDFEDPVFESCEVNAVYDKLKMNGSDFTLDFDGFVNENYVTYITNYMSDGFTSIENGYMQVKNPGKATSLTTNQMYSDFSLEFDVIDLKNKMINDHMMVISFGNQTANTDEYPIRPYHLIFGLDGSYDSDGEYQLTGTHVYVRANLTGTAEDLAVVSLSAPLYDPDNYVLRHEPYELVPAFEYVCDSGLSRDFYVTIKIEVVDGVLSIFSKTNRESDYGEADGIVSLPGGDRVDGMICWQPYTDCWNEVEFGFDNFKVTNLSPRDSEIVVHTDKTAGADGVYSYVVGEGDMRMDIDLRYQDIAGTNFIIKDKDGVVRAEGPVEIIQEDIVIEEVTFDSFVFGSLYDEYSQYADENGVLRLVISMLTTKDVYEMEFNVSVPQTLSAVLNNGDSAFETVTGAFGSAVELPACPAPEGYTFVGWQDKYGQIHSGEYELLDNVTMTAVFEINTYTVRFVDEDGTVYDTQTVEHGKAATAIDDPIKEGMVFAGWDKSFDNVTGDLTITALWEKEGCSSTVSPEVAGLAVGLILLTALALGLTAFRRNKKSR